jgi:hypothetical protein
MQSQLHNISPGHCATALAPGLRRLGQVSVVTTLPASLQSKAAGSLTPCVGFSWVVFLGGSRQGITAEIEGFLFHGKIFVKDIAILKYPMMDPWCWYIYIYANMTGVYGWDPCYHI